MEHNVVYTTPYDSEVEYLEVDNTATCFIDTGILPSNSISVVARIQVLEGYGGWLFEGAKEGSVNEIGFLIKNSGNGRTEFRFGNKVSYALYTFPTEPFLISSFDNPNVLVVNGTNFGVTSPTFSTNYLYSIYLFGTHRINLSSGSAKNCRVYWFKMYNNGVLIRDFIPVRVGQVGYMFDRVSKQLFENKGTGSFTVGSDVPLLRRAVYITPYTSEVEYLQSSGTQYIDTGIKASSSLTILADIDCGTNFGFPFGGANGLGNKEYAFFNSYSSQYRLGGYSVSLNRVTNLGKLTFDNTEDVKVLKVWNDNFSQTYTVTLSNFTSTYNMYLFCENRGGSITQINTNAKIYYFKMYMAGVLVRDFIPVRVGTVGYLYDKISKKLFGNSGTGSFTFGSDVSNAVPMVRHAVYIAPYTSRVEYLESNGTQYIDTEIVSQNNLVFDFQLTETQENNQKAFFGFKEGETETWLVNGMNDVNWGGVDETGHWLYVDFAANHTRCALGYPNRDGVYHFDFTDGNASFTLNDTTYWTSALSGTYNGSRHVFIFWMDSVWNYPQNDQFDRKGIGRIYYFQIRKNGRLLFDGIPVRVGTVGYMFDRISGKLFGNKGTGTFTYGNDI